MDEIINQLRPDNTLALKIFEEIKNIYKLDLRLYGSVAKGTNIKNEYDLDIFYHTEETKEHAFNKLLDITKANNIPYTIKYSEHPYIRISYKGINADLVPISSKYRTSVDRTPKHFEYIITHLKPEQKDQVRLLKYFLKILGLYGADIKVRGFSGYLCELLIIKYENFLNLIKNASEWKRPIIIDLENNKEKDFEEAFVVVDPTDGKRNVAAAVSLENLSKFILYSRNFLKNDYKNFFYPKPFDQTGEYGIVLHHNIEIEDKLYGRLRRLSNIFVNNLEIKHIYTKKVRIYSKDNIAYIGIFPINNKIEMKIVKEGPNIESYKKIDKEIFLKNDKIYIVEQMNEDIGNFVKNFFSKLDRIGFNEFQLIKHGYDLEHFKNERSIDNWRDSLLF